MQDREIVLETIALKKHFGGVIGIDKVDMKLYKNEILAIVGDNGAGKSTLIKCISGAYQEDSGEIYFEGKPIKIRNTSDAKRLGIETVYQDKGLIPLLDAPSNLFLNREKLRNGFILGKIFKFLDESYMRKETEKFLAKVGEKIQDTRAPTSSLSGGQQQMIAVARALYWSAKILIFDEPTNNLDTKEQKRAIERILTIRNNHTEVSIIVISHNLYNVFDLVDRIIVLRNGKVVGIREKDKTTLNEIVSMITGVELT